MIAVPPTETIAIIGAGNGGCAAAAHLAQRGFDIRLYGRSPATTEPLSAIGGIEYEGALGNGFARLPLITNDAGAAIAGADLVLITAPTHAHEDKYRCGRQGWEDWQSLPAHERLRISRASRRRAFGRERQAC